MMRRLHKPLWEASILAGLLATLAGTGWAAESAEALNDQAVELRRRGEYARALELFQRAHALAPTPKTLAQMGLAEMDLHRWVDADGHLTSALEKSEFPWTAKNRPYLEPALASARAHIGQLIVRGPDGAELTVNGRSSGKLPLLTNIRLDEGEATVKVIQPGSPPWSSVVTIRGGAVVVVNAVLVPAPAPILDSRTEEARPLARLDGQRPESAPAPSRTARHVGIALVAAGVAAGTAGVFLLRNRGEDCGAPPPAVCNLEPRSAVPGWVLVGGGLAAAVSGGALILLGRDTSVSAAASPQAVALSVRGRM